MENLTAYATQLLLLVFLSITFLQSGIDKILDWNGNLSWLKSHFSKTFLKESVPFLLGALLVLEMASGILCAVGFIQFAFEGQSSCGFLGAVLSAITFLSLLLGQRIAKDYAGAQTIVVYFIPTIFLVYLMQ